MTLKPLILGAVGLLALLLVAGVGYFPGCAPATGCHGSGIPTPPPHSMRPDDPMLRVGARIYAQQVRPCHGARARPAQLA